MGTLVRYYLHMEPAQDLDGLLEQYAEALWIEERQQTVIAGAVSKGMGGK